MNHTRPILGALALSIIFGSYLVLAQQPQAPPPPMSFFVTGVPKGDGGNYGGLAGADAHCQMLAQAAGRGNVKWVAYLSTQGPGAVSAATASARDLGTTPVDSWCRRILRSCTATRWSRRGWATASTGTPPAMRKAR